MSITNLSEHAFKKVIREYLTPARAISDPQHLRGREAKLTQIDRAFNSPGKHIFIFGDRGVGKTSLAQTAATLHQSADADPILIACSSDSSFFQLVRDTLKRCIPSSDLINKRKVSHGFKVNTHIISYDVQQAIEKGQVPEINSINDAVSIMTYISQYHSKEPVIIFDEFDQISNNLERMKFADFIKQISDQGVGVRLIFCGIGKSLDSLIGAHLSTGRYISEVGLDRLHHDSLWQIVTDAAKALGVIVDQETLIRIGLISDGFPYYVHLIAEQIFWQMFDDKEEINVCQISHFRGGVAAAIAEAQSPLRLAYEKATQKYSDDYQEVLWAIADKVLLRRQVTEIYENSYLKIMQKRHGCTCLEKNKFISRVNNLKLERHGSILEGKGAGWYEFRENIVRGYVRLRAEEQGIRLGIDHHLA